MSTRRTILSMPPELKERIRKFRFAKEIKTDSETLRLLIETGLKTLEGEQTKGEDRK